MSGFRRVAIYLGASAFNAGGPFILLPVLTSMLSPEEYGTLAMFSIVLALFGSFTGLSVHGAIFVQYFRLEKRELAGYIYGCMTILFASTTLVLILTLLLRSSISEVLKIPIEWIVLAIVLSAFQFVINIRLSLWQAKEKAWHYGSLQVSRSLVDMSLSLFFILSINLAWQGRILGQASAFILMGVIAYCTLFKDDYIKKSCKNWIYIVDSLKFGIPLIPHAIGGVLVVITDRLIISNILGLAEAGVYMAALQVGMVIAVLVDSVNKVYAPWLMKKLSMPETLEEKKITRYTYLYMVSILLLSTVFGLLSPLISSILLGPRFFAASDMVIYIAVGFAFTGCYYTMVNYIFFKKKTIILAAITFGNALVNVPVTYFFVKNNGIVGGAQAFLLINLSIFLCTWVYANKVYPMPWLKTLKTI